MADALFDEDFLRKLDPPLEPGTPQFQWLERHLPFEPVIDEPLHGAVQDRTALREVREQARSQWRGG